MTARPARGPDPDDPVEILRVLPTRFAYYLLRAVIWAAPEAAGAVRSVTSEAKDSRSSGAAGSGSITARKPAAG
jgi:hypothetical protein